MSQAIFQTTGQALAVAFVVMSEPPTQDSILRRALIRILEGLDCPTSTHKAWLAQLRGSPSATVNFSGLSADEIRAQCALITQCVRDHLMLPERYAVIGSYTHMPLEKAEAVRFLSNYIKPEECDSKRRLVYDYCVLRCTSKHGNEHVKSARILENLGVSDKSAAAHLREFKKKYNAYRERGEIKLQSIFERHGVVNAQTETRETTES